MVLLLAAVFVLVVGGWGCGGDVAFGVAVVVVVVVVVVVMLVVVVVSRRAPDI